MMLKNKKKPVFIFIWIAIFAISVGYSAAEEFSVDAVSEASKAIAECKTVASYMSEEDMYGEIPERYEEDESWAAEYVLSLDNNRFIESQIRNWEFANAERMSNGYINRLPTMQDAAVSAGGSITIGVLDQIANHPIATVGCSVTSGGLTFMETVDRVARSAQIMNPPVYLDRYTSYGAMGTGAYPIKGGSVYYYETLSTGGPGPITTVHTDIAKTQFGTYYNQVKVSTPASSNFERFVMSRYPVGSYWDPMSSSRVSITRTQQSYLDITRNGITTTKPWYTWYGNAWSYGYPPNLDWCLRHSYGPPPALKMPTFTLPQTSMPTFKTPNYSAPRIPSYSGRKY